jgi:cupin 2 domain-containing protein
MSRIHNIFRKIPSELPEELVQELLTRDGLRIERIVSRGHRSPPGHWYDQDENEWVILLSGRARLVFEDGAESIELRPGDYVEIPAHVRHRVEETSADQDAVWLAVFYR